MRPGEESDLVQMIRAASGPFALRGGGTRGPMAAGAVLDLSGLSGVTLYDPGALTLVAGAGTPLAQVQAALAEQGQHLAFEPPDLRALLGRQGVSSLGGVAAANASGPRRVQAGAARDALIGLRFVDGQGAVVTSGGRVMKNVTGLDLVKLMAGAHGTLGVVTEVAFKLRPAPETRASLCLHDQTVAQAVAAMSAALGSPFEISGAAHLPASRETHLRIEGFAASVAYRTARLQDLMTGQGAQISQSPDPVALWAGLRDVVALAGQPGDLWRLSVQPSTAPGLVARLPEGSQAQLDWGGGLIWVRTPPGCDLRAHLGPITGHATLLSGPDHLPVFAPEPAPVSQLSAALRRKFDPRGILNPGLMP